jgi:hypothetical protein
MMKDYEVTWNEFWKAIVCPDGKIDLEQVKKELHDYHFAMGQVPEVYMHITNGQMSKMNYFANDVIRVADDEQRKTFEEWKKEEDEEAQGEK